MIILGISCFYHDSAAAIIVDGKLIAAAEEERFTRKKHDSGFPYHAVLYCLNEANVKIDQVDYIAFYEKPLIKFDRLMSQHLQMFPFSYLSFLKAMPQWINEKLRIRSIIKKKLKYKGKILFLEHHLSHAASTFLISPFEEAAILTVDGVGEWATTTYGIGKGNEIKLEREIQFPHSLGLLYSTVTAFLGFSVNNSEYKVMGLSPYGNPVYYEQLKKLIDVKEDGSYALDMSYFDYHYKLVMPSKKFVEEFGPIRAAEGTLEQKHKDIAASLQKITEEIMFKLINHLHKIYKTDNLCLAGGVALNSVANGKIMKNTSFKNVFIQPAAGDAGSAIGAAIYVHTTLLGNKREFVFDSCYLGPWYSDEYIQKYLDENKIIYTKLKNDTDLITTTAKLIHENNVIGWFQGRMEWGPRALGSRSILSNASNPEMKEILNAKVKHRELFRPFAPVISEEDVHDYFEMETDAEPFMLFVYPFKKKVQKLVPSVVHVDGSGRLQTINKKQNARYYGVIKAFEKLSKIPILVNTSFNIRGEPIVCTPHDAYRCMMGTGIDYLVIGSYLVARKENAKDMWDSESIAKD